MRKFTNDITEWWTDRFKWWRKSMSTLLAIIGLTMFFSQLGKRCVIARHQITYKLRKSWAIWSKLRVDSANVTLYNVIMLRRIDAGIVIGDFMRFNWEIVFCSQPKDQNWRINELENAHGSISTICLNPELGKESLFNCLLNCIRLN